MYLSWAFYDDARAVGGSLILEVEIVKKRKVKLSSFLLYEIRSLRKLLACSKELSFAIPIIKN